MPTTPTNATAPLRSGFATRRLTAADAPAADAQAPTAATPAGPGLGRDAVQLGGRPASLTLTTSAAASYRQGGPMPPASTPANAPAPGCGRVAPAGLAGGNTLQRFGPDGAERNFWQENQEQTNGCGTTSLAMMLNYHKGAKAFDRPRVDAGIRAYDMYTAPDEVARFAREQGMDATVHTDTSLAELKGQIDQGLPVQVLMDVSADRDGTGLHWVVATGYGRDANGAPVIEVANPNGSRQYKAEQDFTARWSDLNMKGVPTGISRLAVSMQPAGGAKQLLSDNADDLFGTAASSLQAVRGFSQAAKGWQDGDYTQATEGVVRTVGGGITGIVTQGGQAGVDMGLDLVHEGQAEFGTSVGGTLSGGAKVALGGVTTAGYATIRTAGEVGSGVVELGATGVHYAGRGIEATGRGIRGLWDWALGN